MEEWKPSDIVALITAICGVVSVIFSKKAVDAVISILKYRRECREAERKSQMEADDRIRQQQILDEEFNEKGLKWLIRRQDDRITTLESELKTSQLEHKECKEENAQLSARQIRLEERIAYLEGRSRP